MPVPTPNPYASTATPSFTAKSERMMRTVTNGPTGRGRGIVSLMLDFKKFLMKGNLIELAVAFVMGAVFAALLKAFIADLITPIIALIFGQPNFSALSFTINSSHFQYGDFLNNVFTFVTTAAVLFFFVVRPYQSLMDRRATEDPSTKPCPECTSDIPIKARRCPLCTAEIGGPEPLVANGI